MAKQGLNDGTVKAARDRGLYNDGGGLYLQITKSGNKSWVYRFRIHGRLRTMGLGAYPGLGLKEARLAHAEAKQLRDAGTDPILARESKRRVTANTLSVEKACENYIKAQRARWKTEAQVEQMRQRLRDFVYPVIGHLPIAEIAHEEARQVLDPIWRDKNPTADRVRQSMEGVINWAIQTHVRKNEFNPFEVKRLEYVLPFGIHKVTSHPSLAFERAPGFLAGLRAIESGGVKVRAMEFVMLTAIRIADICGGGKAHSEPMKWSHVDMAGQLWTIPDTKMGRPHIVPLSAPAMRLLAEMRRFKDPASDFVFPGANTGTVLNAATLRHMTKAMGYGGELTTHGMRATFRTWASETTSFEKDVIESCLAHAKVGMDRPYMRGDYLAKRIRLMAAWAAFLEGEAMGSVVPLRA